MKNYDILIKRFEDESKNYDNKISTCINTSGDLRKVLNGAKLYDFENMMKHLINIFTLDDTSKKEIMNFILTFKSYFNENFDIKLNHFDVEGYKEQYLEIRINDSKYNVRKLTEMFEDLKFIFRELGTHKRSGQCHIGSMNLAKILDRSGFKCELVTAYVYGWTDKSKYLHSWIDIGNGFVLDYTMNACIPKDLYKFLFKYDEISRIPGQKVGEDIDKLKKFGLDFNTKEYLFFRNEIIKELDGVDRKLEK